MPCKKKEMANPSEIVDECSIRSDRPTFVGRSSRQMYSMSFEEFKALKSEEIPERYLRKIYEDVPPFSQRSDFVYAAEVAARNFNARKAAFDNHIQRMKDDNAKVTMTPDVSLIAIDTRWGASDDIEESVDFSLPNMGG